MASTAEGRYSRFVRRAIFWSLAAAAAAFGALLLGAGQASAKPIEIPGIGAFEVPDVIPVPPNFSQIDYPDIQVDPAEVVPAVVDRSTDIPTLIEIPAADIPAVDMSDIIYVADPPALPVTPAPALAEPAEVVYTTPIAVIEFAATPGTPATPAKPETVPTTPVDLLRTHLPYLAELLEPVLPAPLAPFVPQVVEEPSPGEVAVEAARGKIGSNYSMGATGPDAFDCSGLVQWSYEQAGVDVPRTSYQQLSSGTPVSQDELEPGDMVSFYGGGHSGLYAGDGQVIHASTYGTGVVMSPISSMPYAGARRY
ncbi:Cell wall-associated hydrolase, NlpC family [Nocardia amikacinitolerans]|nr:Cell wall-associated hydrolase, NlpC family [Nocardia amikacinitolerans]